MSDTASDAGPPPGSNRVLVVDDDAMFREILAERLRAEGFQVGCAEDGESAWEAIRHAGFDLLITDHEMPRLSGLSLLRRVRAESPKLPIVVISGNMPHDEADFRTLLPPGATIEKPFSFPELLETIKRVFTPDTFSARSRHPQPLSEL